LFKQGSVYGVDWFVKVVFILGVARFCASPFGALSMLLFLCVCVCVCSSLVLHAFFVNLQSWCDCLFKQGVVLVLGHVVQGCCVCLFKQGLHYNLPEFGST
jgi:hypothetical protein